MAEQIDILTEPPLTIRWKQYADGRLWRLERGVDFRQTPRDASKLARLWARRHNARFRTEIRSEALYIRAVQLPR